MDWFNELQRVTVSPEAAAQIHETAGHIDVWIDWLISNSHIGSSCA